MIELKHPSSNVPSLDRSTLSSRKQKSAMKQTKTGAIAPSPPPPPPPPQQCRETTNALFILKIMTQQLRYILWDQLIQRNIDKLLFEAYNNVLHLLSLNYQYYLSKVPGCATLILEDVRSYPYMRSSAQFLIHKLDGGHFSAV